MQLRRADEYAALFNQAVEHHIRGRLAEALVLYDAAIRSNPNMAAAHCNRGLVQQSLQRIDDALKSYDRAIRLQPDYADAHYNKGIALKQLNRVEAAVQSYDRAIALNPRHVEAHSNRGNALRDLKRPDDALRSFDTAIALRPDFAQAYYNKGNALQDLKHWNEALASYEQAITLHPNFPQAHENRADTLRILGRPEDALRSYDRAIELRPDVAEAYSSKGKTLLQMGRPDEALPCFDKAIALAPSDAARHSERGDALQDMKRLDEALQSYDHAITLKPDYAFAHCNRGNALSRLSRFEEALECYDRAIQFQPDLVEAYLNQGMAFEALLRFEQSLRSYDRAIAVKSDYAHAYWNKSLCTLLTGDFERGWELYEWRKKRPGGATYPDYPQPVWSGSESLEGKTLLIHAEQGLGDTIQFCRYAILAEERGAKVIFAAHDPLVRLLKGLGRAIEIMPLTAEPGGFDTYAALLSLPQAFGTNRSNCPAHVPYLRAEADRIEKWRGRLGPDGFKIGICWQGNRNADIDKGRSFPLFHFERLARIPGVRLISLQKGDGIEQTHDLPPGMSVELLGDEFDSGPDAFLDTAAVIENVDLVVTSDTAVAHLAGALARPVWVALKQVPDWRWLIAGADTSWYPTMKLFRQTERDGWDGVFAAIAAQVVGLLDERRTNP